MGLSDSCPEDVLSNEDRFETGAAGTLASLLELGVCLYTQA